MRIVTLLVAFALLIPIPAHGEEICFPLAVGTRILQDIEALEICRSAVAAGTEAVNSCETRASALEARITEQDREIAKGQQTIEETRRAGEAAAKVAVGPWYQRILNAGKWIAIGAVLGLAAGASR